MHRVSSSLSVRRFVKRAAVPWLAAMLLPMFVAGCTTAAPAPSEQPRFGCYDVHGRLEPFTITKADCDVLNWEWRERK
jgi:hypothetical protein